MKKIDWYIIRKFFTTFLFSIFLILILVIIFDISEKIDDFLEHDLSFFVIISDYYLHFIPYFANLFSPLFIFISVIYFTSRMASNTEIIAIYNSGMSFNRFSPTHLPKTSRDPARFIQKLHIQNRNT